MQKRIELNKLVKRMKESNSIPERQTMRELNKCKLEYSKIIIQNYPGSELIRIGNRRREVREEYYKSLIEKRRLMKLLKEPTEQECKEYHEIDIQIRHLEKTYYERYY